MTCGNDEISKAVYINILQYRTLFSHSDCLKIKLQSLSWKVWNDPLEKEDQPYAALPALN